MCNRIIGKNEEMTFDVPGKAGKKVQGRKKPCKFNDSKYVLLLFGTATTVTEKKMK